MRTNDMNRHIGKIIPERSNIQAFATGIAIFIGIALVLSAGGCSAMGPKKISDTLSNLSFSHDGKKLLFDRCRNDDCQIQVYDLAKEELSAYQSPPDERWTMARYSYDGTKIVFAIIPMGRYYLNFSDMQIAIMDPDGRNVRKITTGPGAKVHPTFSHSGTKVLYARAGYIRKSGRTPAAEFDAWEVDLITGKEKRLTFYKFFGMGNLVYFPDDKRFLCWGFAPESLPGVPENDRKEYERRIKNWKYGANNIFALREGMVEEEPPYVIVGYEYGRTSQNPLLSRDGARLLFESDGTFYLYSPDGNHRRIGGGGSVTSAAISPDGKYLGYIGAGISLNVFEIQDGRRIKKIRTTEKIKYDHGTLKDEKILPEEASRIVNSYLTNNK